MNFKNFLSRTRPRAELVIYGALGLVALALFLFSMYQFPSYRRGVEDMKEIPGYFSFHAYERLPGSAGNPDLNYAWTRPASTRKDAPPISELRLFAAPRDIPLSLTLEMSLARPEGAPPARVEINLLDEVSEEVDRQLAVYDFDSNRPDFNKYTVTIPPDPVFEGATVQIKSNGFSPPGDGRELGVRVKSYTLEMQEGRFGRYLWPQPFIPAALLLFVGALVWAWRVRLDWLELALVLEPLAFVAGASGRYIRPYSWLALVGAAVVVGSAWLWQRDKLPFSRKVLPKPLELWPVWLAVAGMIAFFVTGPSYPDDVNYHIQWLNAVHKFGPFNIYSNEPSLNYLPMTPYLLYLYGGFAAPFGLLNNVPALKAFVSLSLLAMVYIIWKIGRREGQSISPTQLGAVLVMFGFNAAVIYNPVIWGQMDAGMTLLLLASFALAYAGRPYLGALAGGGALIFKPQAIFALPLIGLIILKRAGWRKSELAAGFALAVTGVVTAAAFGFNWNTFVNQFWLQGQLAGNDLDFTAVRAYNFPHLLDYAVNRQQSTVLIGFAIIGLVYGLLAALTWFKGAQERDTSLAVSLAILVCFIFAIKMHERYPFYALPFLALATLFDRRASKPWLVISLMSLTQLIITRLPTRRFFQIPDNFYLWNKLVQDAWDWLPDAISVATIIVFAYALGFYLWRFWQPGRPVRVESDETRLPELVKNS